MKMILVTTFRGLVRDRFVYAILGIAFFFTLMVPILGSFSMRRVQELSLDLSLSLNAFFLLVLGLFLGTSSLWNEIERRFCHSVLTLPVSRGCFLFGKLAGISIFLVFCSILLGLVSSIFVLLSSLSYPSDVPISWMNFVFAITFDGLKAILIAAVAMFFSTVSTSFYLPFFVTLAIYFCGSALEGVSNYLHGSAGQNIHPLLVWCVDFLYYLLPNFSAFNYKIQAIYALPVTIADALWSLSYFCIYSCIIVFFSVFIFNRRQF